MASPATEHDGLEQDKERAKIDRLELKLEQESMAAAPAAEYDGVDGLGQEKEDSKRDSCYSAPSSPSDDQILSSPTHAFNTESSKSGMVNGRPNHGTLEEAKQLDDDDDDSIADAELSSTEEARLVADLRKAVEAKGGSTKDASDATMLRFLRARNLNADKAAIMWCNFVKWRATFVPLGHIPESKCQNELVQKKTCLQGWDKQGRPLVVVQLAKHKASKRSLEEVKCTTVYCADKICASMKPGLEQFSVIVDLAGVGYKNLDLSATHAVFHLLQAYYPERLGKIWIINVPYIFHAFWKMVTPFLYRRTRKKIVFVDNKHMKETLMSEIDEDQLPIAYGGKAELIPIQEYSVPGWPPSA
eukprot:TRINITY_DN5924_c1_g1_i1.p1 TRINITY_DN5924_c1_g1~~TRINITY_DN5924_c1_g1_i1.p1  ORF type:complete len:359 (-),score=61.19 TRINITY_DN5924_c1_g1_i1:25-1101(-)